MQTIHITRESNIPLVGVIPFGIIDRGSNLLQIRPTSCCNMNCTFCSTSANSGLHPINYEVECNYLIQWLKEIIRLKQCNEIEANIDSVGEPTSYKDLIKLIKGIKAIPEVKFISMQTNGTLLTKELIKNLESAGLSRINISLHTLGGEKAKYLFGNQNYNLKKVIESIREISKTKIQLNIVPVWLPKVNDEDLIELIRFAKELNCKIGIQKYEIYKFSRKEKKAKATTWFKFFRHLKALETLENYKLIQTPKDFNIKRIKKIPLVFQKGDTTNAVIVCPGWLKGQMIASANNRAITIVECNKNIGDKIRIKILDTQDSIYIAKKA
jgi:uncharacterized protein